MAQGGNRGSIEWNGWGRPTSVEIFAMQAHADGTGHSAVIKALLNVASCWPSREGLRLRPTGVFTAFLAKFAAVHGRKCEKSKETKSMS